ncbi:hypothetical protein K8O68_04885 [Salipaludibacillus sp. CUR1]|uniref:sugar-transfer associated ATP-grasp domain-containing protein n=1 Tax=Salipaludibacillus sp. CUR1 TaxID=2820003 RepID=UPI001E2ED13C|nr:sugar-transfer associated ATP-grasp domain-containing protein [Salipaludibacillus sp. CUR1]MCE7791765.1 hypothetical protein [Salipaludibacillus sp. CUR1]
MQNIETKPKDLTVYKEAGMKTTATHFRQWLDGGLLDNVDKSFIQEVDDYWTSHYDKTIDPALPTAFMNLTGRKDKRLIPGKVMRTEILPVFNDYDMSVFYKDKNLYDIIVDPPRSPETLVKNINGNYFDADHNSINIETARKKIVTSETDLIIKPSRSNNGNGVAKLTVKDKTIYLDGELITFNELVDLYMENFLIQEAIQQHSILAAPHPASVNTLRMVTFRWKNEIRYLLAFARFGSDNDIRDNAGASDGADGIRVGIDESGKFFKTAISKHGQLYTHHPTTGFCFADLEPIPNFDEYKQFVKDCHKNILPHNIISWDIAMGADGKPVFLEPNFAGTAPFYQLAAQKPFFGDLTDEVLHYVRTQHEKSEPVLMLKDRRRADRKLEEERVNREKQLNEELTQAQKQNAGLIEENKKIKSALKTKEDILKSRNDELEAREKELKAKKNELKDKKTELKAKKDTLRNKKAELSSVKLKYKRTIQSKSWRYTQLFRSVLKLVNK